MCLKSRRCAGILGYFGWRERISKSQHHKLTSLHCVCVRVWFFFFLSLFLPTCNDRNPLECLGQGGRDPLSETLEKGLFAEDNFYSDEVEHAFWNDELQATADAYDADVCAFSAYSDEAFPFSCTRSATSCSARLVT